MADILGSLGSPTISVTNTQDIFQQENRHGKRTPKRSREYQQGQENNKSNMELRWQKKKKSGN